MEAVIGSVDESAHKLAQVVLNAAGRIGCGTTGCATCERTYVADARCHVSHACMHGHGPLQEEHHVDARLSPRGAPLTTHSHARVRAGRQNLALARRRADYAHLPSDVLTPSRSSVQRKHRDCTPMVYEK